MFHLITTYFKSKEPEREAENLECLIENIKNPLIDVIHLFLQGDEYPNIEMGSKLKLIKHGKRPNFSELFTYSNNLNGIKIVANSDIYFNETLKKSVEALKKWDVLALTRWDRLENGKIEFYNNYKSQDVWIFEKNIKKDIGNYHIGRHGCDNRLVFEFKKFGYSIKNPSISIQTIHVHNSNLRLYFNDANYEYVKPPYDYLLPIYCNKVEIQPKDIKKKYYMALYSFYKSKYNNTLPGLQNGIIERFLSFCKSKYFAYTLNSVKK
jgi:hypothetical protein